MVKRIVTVFVIVALPSMNWLQRQLIVFMCSMSMAFIGYFRPFELSLQNNLELVNEVIILLNSYFLFIYSDFVGDVYVRYSLGWYNVGAIVTLVAVNLLLITMTTGKKTLFKYKVWQAKRWNAKILSKRKATAALIGLRPKAYILRNTLIEKCA